MKHAKNLLHLFKFTPFQQISFKLRNLHHYLGDKNYNNKIIIRNGNCK